jgi:uncharacterized protein
MNETLNLILEDLRGRLERLYGERLERLVLFGSQAREDAEPDSDIDVLVVIRGEVESMEEGERTLDLRVDLNRFYGRLVQLTFVSGRRYESEPSPLLINIRREGVRI